MAARGRFPSHTLTVASNDGLRFDSEGIAGLDPLPLPIFTGYLEPAKESQMNSLLLTGSHRAADHQKKSKEETNAI
jgi:hypothetical protein